jgi:hypothetical protein
MRVDHHTIIGLHSFIGYSCVGHHRLMGRSSFHLHRIEVLIITFAIAALVMVFIFIIQFLSFILWGSLSIYFRPSNQL